MTKQVEFFFDFGSSNSYFAHTQLPKIAERAGAEIVYRPFLLGGVFKASGNTTPMAVSSKANWMVQDMKRFAKRYGVPFKFNPHFPINTITLMRGAIWTQENDQLLPYAKAMYQAIWVDERNMNNQDEVSKVIETMQIDPMQFREAVANQDIKDKLRINTDEAVKRGAFGAPTFFVGAEMFFGQDRLDFVEEALNK